jgi:hypothetical protein
VILSFGVLLSRSGDTAGAAAVVPGDVDDGCRSCRRRWRRCAEARCCLPFPRMEDGCSSSDWDLEQDEEEAEEEEEDRSKEERSSRPLKVNR